MVDRCYYVTMSYFPSIVGTTIQSSQTAPHGAGISPQVLPLLGTGGFEMGAGAAEATFEDLHPMSEIEQTRANVIFMRFLSALLRAKMMISARGHEPFRTPPAAAKAWIGVQPWVNVFTGCVHESRYFTASRAISACARSFSITWHNSQDARGESLPVYLGCFGHLTTNITPHSFRTSSPVHSLHTHASSFFRSRHK